MGMTAGHEGMNRLVVVALGLSLTAFVPAQGLPRVDPASVALDGAKLGEATQLLTQFVTEQKIAGAVAAVARRGRLAYFETVGVQDLASKTPMSERSVFPIYSMTRQVTAVAAMMLHEAGKFRLDDPIAKYLPEFAGIQVTSPEGRRAPARAITVEDLFLHTSGVNDRQSELYQREKVRSRAETLPQLMANIVRVGLMEDPGTRFRYGENTSVLGRLVEVWSGMPLDAFFEARVFTPLNMVDTGFVVRPDQRGRWVTVYSMTKGGGLQISEVEEIPFTERPALLEGTVGLVTSVPDYLRFCQMLLNQGALDGARLLKPDTVQRLVVNALPAAVLAERRGNIGWALVNANVILDPASALRGEYSWDGTAGTIFWIDPAREMITLLFAPARPSNPDGIRQKFKALVQEAVRD